MIKKAIIFIICLLLNFGITSKVKAEEIVISGNGSDSSNQVQVQSSNTTSITQNNTANVDNNVNSTANSGNNSASSNNGDSTVKTGDTSSTTTVNNQNINTNSSDVSCGCQADSSITISGNGAGSINNVFVTNSTSTLISQNNTAIISNNINANANTGNNNASYNNGSSSILTGSIYASTDVNNKNINNSQYAGTGAVSGNTSIDISGNGANSFNNAVLIENTSAVITNTNIATITNNVEHNLNTGGNTTMGNVGDAVIITGGIVSNVKVNNENINSNLTEVSCDCPSSNPGGGGNNGGGNPPPTDPGTSTVQGTSGNSSGSGNGSSGPADGNSLPATGSTIPFTLVATLILFFMLLSGLYLRFNAANAPPTV